MSKCHPLRKCLFSMLLSKYPPLHTSVFGLFAGLCLAVLWLGVICPENAVAAQVEMITGPTKTAPHGTAYLLLGAGEQVVAGGTLRVGKGKRARVVPVIEAYGDRVVVKLTRRARAKVGDTATVVAPTDNGRPAPPPKTWDRTGRQWHDAQPMQSLAALDDAHWSAVVGRPRALIRWQGDGLTRRSRDRARGDVRLVGVLVKRTGTNDHPWLQLRLGSRLHVPRLFGQQISWDHDVSVYVDTIRADQAGQRARRLLEVRRLQVATARMQRSWQVRGGRITVPDGSGWQLVDGAAASMRIGDKLSVRAFGGLGPDIVSSALATDVQRFGAMVGWDDNDDGDVTNAALGYSGSLYGGTLDRQLVGGRFYARRGLGTLRADVDLAMGGADLAGTGAANLEQHGPARLHRAWLGVTTPQNRDVVARLRYSYYATQAWRELALAVAWDQLVLSQRHNAVLSVDWRKASGPWVSPMVFGGYASGEDRWDGARLGGAVNAGFAGNSWSVHGGVSYQTGFEQTVKIDEFDMPQRNGHIDRFAAFFGVRRQVHRRLGVGARLSGTQTTVWPVDAAATRARARLYADWIGGPWTVTGSFGIDRAVAMESFYNEDRVDWIDATVLVRRSLP